MSGFTASGFRAGAMNMGSTPNLASSGSSSPIAASPTSSESFVSKVSESNFDSSSGGNSASVASPNASLGLSSDQSRSRSNPSANETSLREGTLIHPYKLPANAGPLTIDVDAPYANKSKKLLTNSGVNTWTDFPVSTSPRMSEPSIRKAMHMIGRPFGQEDIGFETTHRYQKQISTREVEFREFSFDSTFQPRTSAARASEGEPVSPGTVPTLAQMSTEELLRPFNSD